MKLTLPILLSVAWFAGGFLVANHLGEGIAKLKPNEFGDLLAGICAPIAFFWFVIAVFMQLSELELQRQELKGSREALQDASIHSATQAQALADQSQFLRMQNKEIIINSKMRVLCYKIQRCFVGSGVVTLAEDVMICQGIFGPGQIDSYIHSGDYLGLMSKINSVFLDHTVNRPTCTIHIVYNKAENIDQILKYIDSIIALTDADDAFDVNSNLIEMREFIGNPRNWVFT